MDSGYGRGHLRARLSGVAARCQHRARQETGHAGGAVHGGHPEGMGAGVMNWKPCIWTAIQGWVPFPTPRLVRPLWGWIREGADACWWRRTVPMSPKRWRWGCDMSAFASPVTGGRRRLPRSANSCRVGRRCGSKSHNFTSALFRAVRVWRRHRISKPHHTTRSHLCDDIACS